MYVVTPVLASQHFLYVKYMLVSHFVFVNSALPVQNKKIVT